MRLPVFPLPVFLLPDGCTRLNIFEPRYLKMVREAASGEGFIIQTTLSGVALSSIGSWVRIYNFGQREDGLLQIDVRCQSLVELSAFETDPDKLRWALAEPVAHWPSVQADEISDQLTTALQQCFTQHDMLRSLYGNECGQTAAWVVARWLELAPVANQYKVMFYAPQSYPQALRFAAELIIENNLAGDDPTAD